jgi:hypothetical protein
MASWNNWNYIDAAMHSCRGLLDGTKMGIPETLILTPARPHFEFEANYLIGVQHRSGRVCKGRLCLKRRNCHFITYE